MGPRNNDAKPFAELSSNTQVPHLLYALVCLLCCNLLILFLKGWKSTARKQGHTGDSGLFTELQSQAPTPSPRRSLPLCHRDGRPGDTTRQTPQGDRLWGAFVSPPQSSYPLTCRKVTNQKAACQALPRSFRARLESGPFDM